MSVIGFIALAFYTTGGACPGRRTSRRGPAARGASRDGIRRAITSRKAPRPTADRTPTWPRSLDDTFAFFAEAGNLQRLTPPWLDFRILTPLPIEMREGARIDYRLRLRGIPMRWRSAITVWTPPYRFVDEQVAGPYRLWRHAHTFREVPGGTEVRDTVDYLVPGGPIIDTPFVRRELDRIFRHRQQATLDAFGVASPAPFTVTFA